jgi:HTH-type transcriptional regulator, glycine betaine synthesis regulator
MRKRSLIAVRVIDGNWSSKNGSNVVAVGTDKRCMMVHGVGSSVGVQAPQGGSMGGYERNDDDDHATTGTMAAWEALAVDAVGNVIDFWKFKRNQGRVWALLYLRGKSMSAGDLQSTLGLSKGAVSMLVRELEQWGVVRRVRVASDDISRYSAETDLMKMVSGVIAQREATLVVAVRDDLLRAERMAEAESVPADVQERLQRLTALATMVDQALKAFLATMRLDVTGAFALFAAKLPTKLGDSLRDRLTKKSASP